MPDDEQIPSALDTTADRIFDELGVDPDGPISQFTFALGFNFGSRLAGEFESDEVLVQDFASELLEEFAALFPANADSDTMVVQTLFLAPLVSVYLTGGGLSVPQLAAVAGLTSEQLYRANRKGLSIVWTQRDPKPRTGVNRRFSGRDNRRTLLALDLDGITSKTWPEPLDDVQPFLLGFFAAMRSWLELPETRLRFEPVVRRVVADLFEDPGLGAILDGVFQASHRVLQGLRDEVLVMQSQKEQATELDCTLSKLQEKRSEILRVFREAASEIRDGW